MPTLVNNLRAIRGPVTAVPVVGQSGVVVEPDTQNNQVVVRADETVLWEGDIAVTQSTSGISEPLTNFERLRIYNKSGAYNEMSGTWLNNTYVFFSCTYDIASNYGKLSFVGLQQLDNGMTLKNTYNRINQGSSYYADVNDDGTHIVKIIGINRIANN